MQRSNLTLALFALSVPLIAQQTITCSSENGGRHFCPANTKNGVMMMQEHSNGVCQQGSTWSYTRQGISVNSGCSADFQVGAPSNSSNGSGNGYNGYGNSNSSRNSDGSYGNSTSNGVNGSGNAQNGYGQNGNGYPNNNQNGYNNSQNGYNNGGHNQNQNSSYNGRQTATVLPSGARLDVRLEQSVNPREVNRGDYIPGSIVNDVMVNGRTVIPAGTSVQAKVLSAHGSPLDIRLDSTSVNGERYRLISSSIHSASDSISGQSNNQGSQGAAQEIGSILGALTQSSQLPKGSVYTFRLTSSSRPMSSSPDQSNQTDLPSSNQ